MDDEAVLQEIRRDLDFASRSCRAKDGCDAVKRVRDNIEYLYTELVLARTAVSETDGDLHYIDDRGDDDLL